MRQKFVAVLSACAMLAVFAAGCAQTMPSVNVAETPKADNVEIAADITSEELSVLPLADGSGEIAAGIIRLESATYDAAEKRCYITGTLGEWDGEFKATGNTYSIPLAQDFTARLLEPGNVDMREMRQYAGGEAFFDDYYKYAADKGYFLPVVCTAVLKDGVCLGLEEYTDKSGAEINELDLHDVRICPAQIEADWKLVDELNDKEGPSYAVYLADGIASLTYQRVPPRNFDDKLILEAIDELEGGIENAVINDDAAAIKAYSCPVKRVEYDKGRNEDSRHNTDLYFHSGGWDYRLSVSIPLDFMDEYGGRVEGWLNNVMFIEGVVID